MSEPPASSKDGRPRPPLKRQALAVLRKGNPTLRKLESSARSLRNGARYAVSMPVERVDFFARSGGRGRFGVYGMGGCDVRTIVGAGPMIANKSGRSVCVGSFGAAPETRSDLLVQTLEPPPSDMTAEVTERLGLSEDYFKPRLFEQDFGVPAQVGLGRWPKDVVVLSVSSDVGRTVYRHKQHGFLVDPGGWWLSADMNDVLGDLEIVKWFASTFAKTSRIDVEESMNNFRRIVTEVRQRTGAYVVFLNVLTVDPGKVALDYKHANSPNRVRRRQFHEAVAQLGSDMDFPVVNVDRITKQLGISGQADFVHYTKPQKRAISAEFVTLLREAGLPNPD